MSSSAVTGTQGRVEPVTVLIPAYNEVEGLPLVLGKLRKVLGAARIEHELLVVNDGSTDGTAMREAEAGVRVISHPKNRGLGAALKTGIRAARYERIVTIDADGTYPADAIPEIVRLLDHADMVVGDRRKDQLKPSPVRWLAKGVLGLLANHLTQTRIPDLTSGLRAFRKACVQRYLDILPNAFSFYTTITVMMLSDRLTVRYLPISYYDRVGQSKIVPWDAVSFVRLFLRMILLCHPMRVFAPLGLLVAGLGAIRAGWSLLVVHEPHPFRATLTLCVGGVLLLLVGLVAEGLSRWIRQRYVHGPDVSTQ